MLVSVEEFDYSLLQNYKILPAPRGNRGTRKKLRYLDLICAFDIETTRLEDVEQSFMYVWQFQISTVCTVIGRTWEQFLEFQHKFMDNIPEDACVVVFVHNLSYEFTFLKGIYPFDNEEVFAVDSRKVVKCYMFERFEFRCSYIQTNMSLKEFTYKMNVEHKKLDDFVYTEKRYPWTELSAEELAYCQNDVWGLVEAIQAEMDRDGDNLYTIPITSTGYVRRDVKQAMRKISHYYIRDIQPSYEVYELLRQAFRGGNTHANRFYATSENFPVVLHDVKSADRSSSYPDVLCNCLYPVKPFFKSQDISEDYVRENLIRKREKAVLMSVILEDVSLKYEWWGCPYLAKAKCRNILNGLWDNGRILSADYLETTITDVDLKILDAEYNFTMTPLKVFYSAYGKLPKCLTDVIRGYYRAKTELKGVPGQENFYMKSKNLLNSIYGMMATDPVRIPVIYDRDALEEFYSDYSSDPEDLLDVSSRKAFVAYQWGVWTTAWARYRLEEGIRLAGDNFIYADTDSVKYLGEIDWSRYNKQREEDSTRSGSFADDPKGNRHYMGVFEYEDSYSEFSTMGAKKYVGRHGSGPLEVTIAGVSKKKGAVELEANGGITAFQEGFIFRDAGGLEAIYNDKPVISEYHIDGHVIPITSNVVLRPSTYTLGITGDYKRLLTMNAVKLDKILHRML